MRMMVNQGAPIPADHVEEITQYLIKTFPEKGKPPGVSGEGPVKVTFKSWQAPTPGSRPHDPLAARDGSLWYTGWVVSTRRQAISRNTRSRLRTLARTAWSRIKRVTSGTQAILAR